MAAAPTLTISPPLPPERAYAEQHGDNCSGLRVGEFLAHLGQMTASDVAGFVGEYANKLIGHGRLL
jgi:hypothetical protein